MLPKLSSETSLRHYLDLLVKWQTKINLISPSTVQNAWERHFEDSLQILDLLPGDAQTLMDLGCGAGFPGLVLAIERPKLSVHLVESDQKKCAFLKTVSRETHASNVTVHNKRIENMIDSAAAPDVITARALASLIGLFDYIYPWVLKNPSVVCLFPKGEEVDKELEIVRKKYDFDVEKHASCTLKTANILKISDISLCE